VFTGLIEETGRVAGIESTTNGRRLWFEAAAVLEGTQPGDSIAVNGCCLTVAAIEPVRWAADVVPETLARTTIGAWREGDRVNFERSMRLDQRLGGHLVQGHVDGVGEIERVDAEGDGRRMRVAIPAALRRYVAEKGSISIDGTSLTVAAVTAAGCEVALVPHTLEVTVAKDYAAGCRVHLEVDLIARYLARLLDAGAPTGGGA
jgi:riboflavin synthase